MVPPTSDREMMEFGGRPWREAWSCLQETLLVHVWPIVFQQFPSFVVCLCSKKNGKTPAAKFEICQNFWRPGFFWVWILCDGSSNKVQQPPGWNFTVFQPYPTSILPVRATLKAEKQQGNPALAAQRISERGLCQKLLPHLPVVQQKIIFQTTTIKASNWGVILISGQTLLVELLGINHQQDRIKSGVYKGHPQNPETQLL